MAVNPQFKVNQLAKDLGIKPKNIVDILADKKIEVKTQTNLEGEEFDLFFETLTRQHQIKNIEDYIDGVTYIPSKKKPVPKVETPPVVKEEAKPEEKAPEKPAIKAEEKPAAPAAKTPAAPSSQTAQAPRAASPRPADTGMGSGRTGATGFNRPQRPGMGAPGAGANGGNAYNRPSGGMNGMPGNRTGAPNFRQGTGAGNGGAPFGGFGAPAGRFPSQGPSRNERNQKSDKNKNFQQEHGGPKEKFKVQPIVRSYSSGPVDPAKRGATRVVDMRSSSVDLSKYDEKLDSFVPDSYNTRGGTQRVRKQTENTRPTTRQKVKPKKPAAPIVKAPLNVQIPDEIIVSDLASRLKVTAGEVVKKLMMMGMMVTVNQTVDFDTAALVADEFGANVTKEVFVSMEEKLFTEEGSDDPSQFVERAPVVCVMGHVDHGKTSLLDAIRHTSVTAGEAGGITQHIGAYRVKVKDKDITFLDTPGHEAFTAMRARGAQATDIAILVVAADDGIMPQTVEAINHAKAAGVDIIVAINKMDKPGANPDAVKQALTKYDLVPEEWGGDVICVPVSAIRGDGIDSLLENVLLVAEVKELKANPNCRAKGIVIESRLDKGRGSVATVLVQNGTLHAGDIVIAGTAVGRVRAMTDHNGRTLKEAAPSVPVEIIGLDGVPEAGDEFNAVEDERMARTLADQRRSKAKEEEFKANARANLNDLFAQISEGVKDLNIIVKADVAGSAEAVKSSLEKISNEEVKVRVIHSAAGAINEGDVMLASASNAIIVGFNVRPDKTAIDVAERQKVEIRTYRVIYECIEEIEAAIKGMLAPKFKEVILGHAEVRQAIHVPSVGTIAGSYITDGKVTRSAQIRVLRDGVVIFEDKISSLRRFKDDVREVADGYECGIGLDRFNDIKVGDVLEAFSMEEIQQ